ncbi:hypothetical protein CASFOL_035807 [Castilleja foliolosa]|uniref:Phytocyanin domain-containing protein n=1 Tax=Castilleja foliolosa TaxID=1961234 RepID=A0ABD3BTR6_9LAMI
MSQLVATTMAAVILLSMIFHSDAAEATFISIHWNSTTESKLKSVRLKQGGIINFVYEQFRHDVQQVNNQHNYDTCTFHYKDAYWCSGIDRIQLNQKGWHYFMCSYECPKGMKIKVNVV